MMKSLSARLTYRIMAVVLVMMVIVTGVVYFTVREYMLDEAKERYLGVLLKAQEETRRKLSDVYVAARNNVHEIERDIDDPDKIEAHMERIVKLNSRITRCGLLYKSGYFADRGRCFGPFATRDADSVVHVGRIDSTYNVYIDTDWFQKGLTRNESDWSEVFFEEITLPNARKRPLSTYYIPVYHPLPASDSMARQQRQPVAVLCADLSLESLHSCIWLYCAGSFL